MGAGSLLPLLLFCFSSLLLLHNKSHAQLFIIFMSSPQSVNTGVCSFHVKKKRKEKKVPKNKNCCQS